MEETENEDEDNTEKENDDETTEIQSSPVSGAQDT